MNDAPRTRLPKNRDFASPFSLTLTALQMHSKFAAHVESLETSLQRLLTMPPVKPDQLLSDVPPAGVYLISEGERHIYVGRSNNLRRRMRRHGRPGATHRQAALAFRIAREATGNLKATYKTKGSRADLMADPKFSAAFARAKERIRQMDLRFVGESEPTRQALLEIYVAVVLGTPYNDFDTH